MISFIVSSHERPLSLMCCLASLAGQNNCESEIIVCDNSDTTEARLDIRNVCCRVQDYYKGNIRYLDTHKDPPVAFCYYGLEVEPIGNWLCFPSDDSYYVPEFYNIMLGSAALNGWDFVCCDMLYDPRLAHATRGVHSEYSVLNTSLSLGRIDKTGFIVSRAAFEYVGGWPPHAQDWRDGAIAASIVAAGIRHGHVPGPMVVHN